MARRTKANDKAGGWFFLILAVGFVLLLSLATAALIMPAVLLLGALVNRSDRRKFTNQSSQFEQTSPRKGDSAKRQRNLKIYQQLMQRIEQQGEGLQRRKDGFFSERSELGKTLNIQLEKIQRQIENEQAVIGHVEFNPKSRLAEQERLERMRTLYSRSIWLYLLTLGGFAVKFGLPMAALIAGGISAVILLGGLWLYVPTRIEENVPERHSEIHQ
jgi:hypothetical protein